MKPLDWILAAIFVGLFAGAAWMIQPTYGWAIGAALGAFLIYRAKLRRDRLSRQDQNQPPE
jgi:4-hydroxybenzoate polyprenyltransferase